MSRVYPALAAAAFLLAAGVASADKEADVKKYTTQLKAKDAGARLSAAEELGKIARVRVSLTKDSVPALIDATKDKDAKVRAAAAKALGATEPDPDKAVPALLAVFNNEKEDMPVRRAALEGLAGMGKSAKEAADDLRAAGKKVREAAQKEETPRKKQQMEQFARFIMGTAQAIGGR